MGVGTCAIKSFNSKAIQKILKLPDYVSPELIISIGYPMKEVKPLKRKTVEEVSFENRWGERI